MMVYVIRAFFHVLQYVVRGRYCWRPFFSCLYFVYVSLSSQKVRAKKWVVHKESYIHFNLLFAQKASWQLKQSVKDLSFFPYIHPDLKDTMHYAQPSLWHLAYRFRFSSTSARSLFLETKLEDFEGLPIYGPERFEIVAFDGTWFRLLATCSSNSRQISRRSNIVYILLHMLHINL